MSKFNVKRRRKAKKHLVITIPTEIITDQLKVQLERKFERNKGAIFRSSKYRKKLQSDVRKKISP